MQIIVNLLDGTELHFTFSAAMARITIGPRHFAWPAVTMAWPVVHAIGSDVPEPPKNNR